MTFGITLKMNPSSKMPYPVTQSILAILLAIIFIASIATFYLWIWGTQAGRIFEAQRWAITVSGLSVIAAFYQYATTSWIAKVIAEYDDVSKYPSGPPSYITRMIIDNPDTPIRTAIRNFLFFDPWLAAYLGFWAGFFGILSAWIDR